MAIHDYVIANQNGANTRSDLNNALAAIVSNNSSASAPTTTYAFMWWADTANDILKQRNAADSAWINILTLSTGAPLAGFKNDGTENLTSLGIDDNATSTAITIDASENVGVGTTAPASPLHIFTSTGGAQDLLTISSGYNNPSGQQAIAWKDAAGNTMGKIGVEYSAASGGALTFGSLYSGGSTTTERMRIDSSGNVMVGTTNSGLSSSASATGINLKPNSDTTLARNGGAALYLNRIGSDGVITQFRKDGTTVGSIAVDAGRLTIDSLGTNLKFRVGGVDKGNFDASFFYPGSDNNMDCGHPSVRWNDIRATNATIQTSDRNEKQDIELLSTAEQNIAIACKGLLRSFRWKSAVAEKGDDARIHFGIIAQDLQDAFAVEGLDAGRYAMFISDTWYEKEVEVPAVEAVEAVEATYDDEGAELTPAVEAVEAKDAYTRTDTEDEPTDGYTERTRLGVRYPELLAFIISAM